MSTPIHLDVLILYNQAIVKSASDTLCNSPTPFAPGSKNEEYNTVYGYFLETCQKHNLSAGFSTSVDIIGPGTCRSFWKFDGKVWSKVNTPCFSSQIFDKFSPTRKKGKSRRRLLFSSANIRPFNDPSLFELFFDKQKTYDKLSKYSIPTISLNIPTFKGVKIACKNLAKLTYQHPSSSDFSQDIVMKDRFGAGGRRIYKFKPTQIKQILSVVLKNINISYIIQPFTKFDQGFSYNQCKASTDIRLIYLNGKIIQSYIRVAKPGEFRCNEHQGGLLTYLSLDKLPIRLVAKSNLIAKILNKKHSLYTLDFIISNNGNAYFLEGNTGPGLDWDTSRLKNEIEAKKLIDMIVEEFAIRSKADTDNLQKTQTPLTQDTLPSVYLN